MAPDEVLAPCECAAAGNCPRFGKMSPHLHQLCGRGEEWRRAIAKKRGIDVPEETPLPPCRFRGEVLRMEECRKCGNRQVIVEIFPCAAQDGKEVSAERWWAGQFRDDVCRTCKFYEPEKQEIGS